VIQLRCRVFNGSLNVLSLQFRVVGKNLLFGHPRSEQVEHILNKNSRSPDGRASTALLGIKSDSLRVIYLKEFTVSTSTSQALFHYQGADFFEVVDAA